MKINTHLASLHWHNEPAVIKVLHAGAIPGGIVVLVVCPPAPLHCGGLAGHGHGTPCMCWVQDVVRSVALQVV